MSEEDERRAALEVVQADGTDGNCVTFVLHDEDHTLGNSLRYMVMKNPDVEFCGYCITHPSESKINFRIQTRAHEKVFLLSLDQRVDHDIVLSSLAVAGGLGREKCVGTYLGAGSLPAVEPFRKGLNDLMGVCQHVLNTFERSMREYRAQREEEMQ